MADRVDKLRRKIQARRRKINSSLGKRERSQPHYFPSHNEFRDEPDFYYAADKGIGEPEEKFIRKDILIFQILASICLFLIVGIIFKTGASQFEGARQFVQNSYQQEFQFETVAHWYEDQFGKPLALLPTTNNLALDNFEDQEMNFVYAVPAVGRVTKSFDQDGKGVIVETTSNSSVEAAKGGMVRFVAEEEKLGKTVIIAHYDGGESWYAMLDKVEVNLYDHVEAGNKIGTVSLKDEKGSYYFALKEGETFINPIDVISFE